MNFGGGGALSYSDSGSDAVTGESTPRVGVWNAPPLTRTPSAFFGSAHVLIWFGVVRHMYLPQSGAPVASTSPHQSAGKSKLWKLTWVV